MSAELESEIGKTTLELTEARARLGFAEETLAALALQEVTAQRALRACRYSLVIEQGRHPALQQSLAESRAARRLRLEEEARAAQNSDCGE